MNNIEFVSTAASQRKVLPSTAYFEWLRSTDQFKLIVVRVIANNAKWAEKVGFNKVKTPANAGLSDKEIKWKKFFQSHSFDSSAEQRNFADAFSIVENMDLSVYLKFDKAPMDRFPAYITVVPIGNSNEHNYKIGEPIFTYSRGTTFLRTSGSSGNSMSVDTSDYRMAGEEETEALLASLMYRTDSLVEAITFGLLDS